MTTMTYDSVLETEEFITAEEYLERRERGNIDPQNTRLVPPDLVTGTPGGFMVKLDVPRYRPAFEQEDRRRVF